MKKIIFFALLMILAMSTSTAFASNLNPKNVIDNPAIPPKTDTKLTEAQATQLKNRVEEIRDMDKSKLSSDEKLALRKEVKEIKQTVKRDGGYIYIGTGALILIIILLVVLL